MSKFKVLNSKGEAIVLNAQEQMLADELQIRADKAKSILFKNSFGVEIDITTLTQIMKKITEQKFFQIAPADFLPVRVGEGAWSSTLLTYRSFQVADDFETGLVNQGGNNGRLAAVNAAVDAVPVKTRKWAKTISWTLMEIAEAARAGNWDLITELESARKKNWDLGIQRIAFLGSASDSSVKGLLTQDANGVNIIDDFITEPISAMSPVALKAFAAGLVNQYRVNNNRTEWPSHLIIPESDYLGLGASASADFPIKSVLQYLEEAFSTITKKPFKIMPLSYADYAFSEGILPANTNRYTMLNYDESSVRMDIPVDYTNTLANSIDNFSFQNVGYGQFTGVQVYRPKEMLYFDIPTPEGSPEPVNP